jgi:hypothetical protein
VLGRVARDGVDPDVWIDVPFDEPWFAGPRFAHARAEAHRMARDEERTLIWELRARRLEDWLRGLAAAFLLGLVGLE